MYDWYFSEDFLKKVLRKVPQQLDRLRKLSKKRELADWEMDVQMALCDLTRQRIDELIKKAEKAKAHRPRRSLLRYRPVRVGDSSLP